MTVPPYAVAYVVTLLVSWSGDHFNLRALHAAVFSTIGAIGFLASAVLPPDYYTVSFQLSHFATQPYPGAVENASSNRTTTTEATIRLSYSRSIGRLRLHSSTPGVAFVQHTHHGRHRSRHSAQHLDGSAGADCGSLDL